MAERKQIIETLANKFRDDPRALAMWQGGAAAFERADEWSDIDIMQKSRFEIFWVMVDKELNRKKDIDAFIFYWSYTLAPLIEMLRIRHSPMHWNFGSRYLNEDLPADIAARFRRFFFVKDLDDLIEANTLGREWFYRAAKEALASLS